LVECTLLPLKVQNQLFRQENGKGFLQLETLSESLDLGAITKDECRLGKVLNLIYAYKKYRVCFKSMRINFSRLITRWTHYEAKDGPGSDNH
jgi:hypothetical protein